MNVGSAGILHIVRAIVFPDLGTDTIDRFYSQTLPVLESSHQEDWLYRQQGQLTICQDVHVIRVLTILIQSQYEYEKDFG